MGLTLDQLTTLYGSESLAKVAFSTAIQVVFCTIAILGLVLFMMAMAFKEYHK